jgi:predicted transcriptional regulator
MYRQKSEIIKLIQSYHRDVATLYHDIYEKVESKKPRSFILNLYEHEKDRERYLERHRKIAEAINCWLDFPCEKLSDQISECLKHEFGPEYEVTMEDLRKLELHFDDCLIKLYNILAAENALNEMTANIFYYLKKKTMKEQDLVANMAINSENNL